MPDKKAWSTCTTSRWTAPRGKKSSARISPPDTTTPRQTCRSSYPGMRRCLRPTAARNAWRCSRASRTTAPGCVRRCIIAGGTRTTPMRHLSMMSGRDSTRRYFANTGENIAPDGAMRLKLDSGRSMDYDPQRHPHLDHGYAMTSYSSQGQTAERVLIHVATELAAKDLLNSRMAYVSVSRGQWDAQIFTNNLEKLPQALGRDVSHQSAYRPEQAIAPLQQEAARSQQPEKDLGMGIGLGFCP